MSWFRPQRLLGSSPHGSLHSLWTYGEEESDREREPLIIPAFSGRSTPISTSLRHIASPSPPPRRSTRQQPVAESSSSNRSVQDPLDNLERRATMETKPRSRFRRFADKLAVEKEPGLNTSQLMLTNYDLKPVEPARRTWRWANFVAFWIADSFNINTWMISSSMITSFGLSWWQSWICVWLGYAIAAIFVVITARIGATYHIGFPIITRASFGIWGSLWPVFNRAVMACIWYGVQAWIGGECVVLMLRSIWSKYDDMPNSMPANAGTDTKAFVGFFLFWAGSLIAIWFPVHQIKVLFTVKAYFVPVAGVAFFIWSIKKAGGVGPIVHQPGTATGSVLAWGMIKGTMSSIANFATLIVNSSDFSRFARKPNDALYSQLFTIPIGFAITSFIGIIVSSSSSVIYHDPIWNPLDLLGKFLDEGGHAQRFGVFIISTAFCLAQLGTNIAANSVSAGTDLSALFPKYINIRRGGYICALVGLVMCPWNLLKSSNQFTSYLSSYSVFLSSIAGCIVCDYYFVRKGYLKVNELYDASPTAPYYYTLGFHWRGYVAYIAGILINVVGFAGAVGQTVPIGATYIYNLNFFCGFIVASAVYYGLCRVFPIPATSDTWLEVGDEYFDSEEIYDAGDSGSGDQDAEAYPSKSAEEAKKLKENEME